jgi:hypothetical protein
MRHFMDRLFRYDAPLVREYRNRGVVIPGDEPIRLNHPNGNLNNSQGLIVPETSAQGKLQTDTLPVTDISVISTQISSPRPKNPGFYFKECKVTEIKSDDALFTSAQALYNSCPSSFSVKIAWDLLSAIPGFGVGTEDDSSGQIDAAALALVAGAIQMNNGRLSDAGKILDKLSITYGNHLAYELGQIAHIGLYGACRGGAAGIVIDIRNDAVINAEVDGDHNKAVDKELVALCWTNNQKLVSSAILIASSLAHLLHLLDASIQARDFNQNRNSDTKCCKYHPQEDYRLLIDGRSTEVSQLSRDEAIKQICILIDRVERM